MPQAAQDQVRRVADFHFDKVNRFSRNLDANVGVRVGTSQIRIAEDSYLVRSVAVLKMIESTNVAAQFLDEEPKLSSVGATERMIGRHHESLPRRSNEHLAFATLADPPATASKPNANPP